MHTLRLSAVLFMAASLSACGGGATVYSPPNPFSTPSPSSGPGTLAVTSSAPQTLASVNKSVATVAFSAASGTPANASVSVVASTTPPAGTPALLSRVRRLTAGTTRTTLAYFTFVPNVDIQLTSFPTFTISFPADVFPVGSSLHEAFLDGSTLQPVYTLDISNGANGSTLVGNATALKLSAGKSYVFAFYYDTTSVTSPAPTSSPSATATATPTASASATPTINPSATPIATPTASPTPNSSPTAVATTSPTPVPTGTMAAGYASGSATFSNVSASYDGDASTIALLDTIGGGSSYQGSYNTLFESIPHGQSSDTATRKITLEVNDSKPISSGTTYTGADINGQKVNITYNEMVGSGASATTRSWLAMGGTVSFENVGNGAATYRMRGVTFMVNPNYGSNPATGTFTLDAVGTANPFSQT